MTGAARIRTTGEDFGECFEELKEAVRKACARLDVWEERVAAGIGAVLRYAAERPQAARALTVQARSSDGDRDRQEEVLEYFAELLSEISPADERFPISTDAGIVDSISAVIRGHLLGGTHEALPALAPDLLFLALLPYLGHERTITTVQELS